MNEMPMVPSPTIILQLFKRSKGKLAARELKTKGLAAFAAATDSASGASHLDRAITQLLVDGLLEMEGRAKDGPHPRDMATYRLTANGQEAIKPQKPDKSDEQLEAQRAFILLQVFKGNDNTLTRGELNGTLRTVTAQSQLEFDIKNDPATVDYHLHDLVENQKCLLEISAGSSVKYRLDPSRGTKAITEARQHDNVSFQFKGETLNALIAAARQSISPMKVLEPPAPTTTPNPSLVQPHDLENYINQLAMDKYAGHDLIPIHEIRSLVARNHGPEAASHPAFDPIIKQMRSGGKLKIIAISDNRDATPQQLNDSIPGMNETLFYVVRN